MRRSVCGMISKFYVGHKGLSGLCVEGTVKEEVCHGAGIPSTLAQGAIGGGETHHGGMLREHGMTTS